MENVETFNGIYTITPLGSNFTVQLNGDEVVFSTKKEALHAIYMDVLDCLWSDPPYEHEKMVNNNQIQEMIEYINNDTNRKKMFFEVLPKSSDGRAIKSVLNEGFYEEFDRYDSDVSEQFINLYQNLRTELIQFLEG